MNKHILFLCKGQFFALSIDRIEKIILCEKPVVVPETSDYILGYTSYEGKPMPMIDLNQRFFGEETQIEEATKVIVVYWQGEHLGLLVDEVLTVQEFQKDKNESASIEAHESYITDTFHFNDHIILEIDINKMFVDQAGAELHRLLN